MKFAIVFAILGLALLIGSSWLLNYNDLASQSFYTPKQPPPSAPAPVTPICYIATYAEELAWLTMPGHEQLLKGDYDDDLFEAYALAHPNAPCLPPEVYPPCNADISNRPCLNLAIK